MKHGVVGLAFIILVMAGLSGCEFFRSTELEIEIKPSVVAGKPPLVVQFEAVVPSKAKKPISYQWHFGDTLSDLGHPVEHSYIASGTYKVNLIVTDALGNIGRAERTIKVIDFSRSSQSMAQGAGVVVSSDFNGDRRPDLAVANRIQGNLSIFLAQPNGQFQLARTLGNGRNFSDVIGVDFDGDGFTDLGVSDLVNSVILIFTSNGKGAFKDPTTTPIFLENFLVASGPQALTSGDFNGDGKVDVATANQTTDNISVLFGDGEGRLELAHVFEPHQIGDVVAIQTANIDHDGLDDLVILNQTSGQAEVFLGRGDGTFVFHLEVSGGERPKDLLVQDFDRDGFADIAIANADGRDISMWWGKSNTRFDSPGRWEAGHVVDRLAVADVDGDGHLDMLTLDRQAGRISILLAQSDQRTTTRSFEKPFDFVVGETLDSFHVDDLNTDGHQDLVVTTPSGKLDLLFNITPSP